MNSPEQILVVDDDETIRITLADALEGRGFRIQTAVDAAEALDAFDRDRFDVALLDLKLPGTMDGVQLMSEIGKRSSRTIVILMSGYATLDSAITALRQGAYDYLLKPFSIAQVIQSIEHALAKHREASTPSAIMTNDSSQKDVPIKIDHQRRRVFKGEREILLSATEFGILAYLVDHANRIVTPGEIMRMVQGYQISDIDARPIVRVHVQRIRQKLEDDSDNPRFIKNVRGRGYRYTGG